MPPRKRRLVNAVPESHSLTLNRVFDSATLFVTRRQMAWALGWTNTLQDVVSFNY